MSRIAHNSVNGRLNRNTFCSGAEAALVQCKRGLKADFHSRISGARDFLRLIVDLGMHT